MTTAIMYLDTDPNPNKQAEFARVAADLSIKFNEAAQGLHSGDQILRVADFYDEAEVSHLIFDCHGFSTRLLSSRAGVHVTQHKPPAVVSLDAFVKAWAPKLARDCKVSLAACMCGRDPYAPDDYWAPSSHADSGANSFAGKLRDALLDRGVLAEVRSHSTPGHVIHSPACRVFMPKRGELGRSLFNTTVGTIPGVKRDWSSCRKFNNLVRGALATRWILFDDAGLVEEIKQRW